MSSGEIFNCDDGVDIVLDGSINSWHYNVVSEGEKTRIVFRKSNGKSPLSVKQISDVNLGEYAKRLIDDGIGINYAQNTQ